MNKLKKVIIITNVPAPHRISLFNEIDLQLKNFGISLIVIFGAFSYQRRKWNLNTDEMKFNYKVLKSQKFTLSDEKTSFSYTGLVQVVKQEKPDVVITNGFSPATVKIWILSLLHSLPFIIWSGSIMHNPKTEALIRKIQRKLIIKKAVGFLAYGTMAKEYLLSLGVPSNRVRIALNTVDTNFFKNEAIKARKQRANSEIHKLLYIGYLVPRKDVITILKVVERLSKQRSDFILDIVGDGREREKLEQYSIDHNISRFVHFHGFMQKHQLPLFLGQSDCFLFHTTFDIWGLVLVEAMAAGVPCIASVKAGSTQDLIKNGINGFSLDFSKIDDVVNLINDLLNNPQNAKKIGHNAMQFISNHVNLEKVASSFVEEIVEI